MRPLLLAAAAVVGLLGALSCLALLIAADRERTRSRAIHALTRWLAVDRIAEDLAQAGLGGLRPETWITLRIGLSLAIGVVAYVAFGVLVLGVVGCAASYHLIGLFLERRRRRRQLEGQQALLEAIRYGAAVMVRGGNASDMLQALSANGPMIARPIFAELVQLPGGDGEPVLSLPERVAAARDRLAEPLFDDLSLALILHWKRGAKLVPALDAIVQDWAESVQLQRDAQVMRAGVEATVLILTILPIVFLTLLEVLSPQLLQPFRSPAGQGLLGLAVLWMVLGYGVLQRMSEPPREERLKLEGAGL